MHNIVQSFSRLTCKICDYDFYLFRIYRFKIIISFNPSTPCLRREYHLVIYLFINFLFTIILLKNMFKDNKSESFKFPNHFKFYKHIY